jgi:hypothetical protein
MSTKKKLPILLIPVYKGGQLFSEAIDSIIPCLPWFDQVIISLNGVDVWDDKATALRLVDRCRLTILATNRTLSAVRHLRFILKQCFKSLRLTSSDQIFLLCHDDLLCKKGFDALDYESWLNFCSDWVSLGDYKAFSNGTSLDLARHESWFSRYDSLCIRPQEEFMKTQYTRHDDPFTNASGMRMGLGVISSISRYFVATGSKSGMRFEYSIIVSKRVSHVVNFFPPLVCIRERPDSEGAIVTRSDFAASELRYAIWIWINCKSYSQMQVVLRGQYGIKGLLWLTRLVLLHRYYELQGRIRSKLVTIALISP